MARMNVDYDLLTWEGDILRLKFWARAFEVLKEKGAVYLRQDGRLAGCWVMPIQEDLEVAPAEQDADGDEERGAGEGHRPLQRRRHLCRQGHRLPVLEARAARQGLQLPDVHGATAGPAVGHVQHRTAKPLTRRSAAPPTSTT